MATQTSTTVYTVTTTVPQSTPYSIESLIFNKSLFGLNDTPESQASTADDYSKLVQEIETTISNNDVLFQQIQKSNYPNPGKYQSDLINFKIDTQVKDLTKTRSQIWDFINKKYTENTGLKHFYYDENRKADEFILQQSNELSQLNALLSASNLKDTTLSEQIKQESYQVNKAIYYRFLYLVLMVCGIICVILLALKINGIFNGGLILSLLIIVGVTVWVIYYIFIKHIARSNIAWNKNNYSLMSQNSYSPLNNHNSNNSLTADKKAASEAVDIIVASEKNEPVKC
uniref:Uncharacterized protein n=1 Tax=viral metagenome TaxID=1070528 RepID=A0A6C0HKJ2_9ZZZZ